MFVESSRWGKLLTEQVELRLLFGDTESLPWDPGKTGDGFFLV